MPAGWAAVAALLACAGGSSGCAGAGRFVRRHDETDPTVGGVSRARWSSSAKWRGWGHVSVMKSSIRKGHSRRPEG
ncbi:hypothetical protein FB570_111338 [Streptomyces sp. T12]|nr:hypothetical protein FB570_111338 [Streptomyces sp. T12]